MEVDLLLVRHAIAEERRPGLDDAERVLTQRGRERFSRSVRGLARLGWRLDLILTSPWRRAVQTAELCRPLLEAGGSPRPTPHLLEPPGPGLLEEIAAEGSASLRPRRIALVGHEPWMGALCGWLLVGPGGRGPRFKKGGVALLHGPPRPGCMELEAFLPPRVSRGLAAG